MYLAVNTAKARKSSISSGQAPAMSPSELRSVSALDHEIRGRRSSTKEETQNKSWLVGGEHANGIFHYEYHTQSPKVSKATSKGVYRCGSARSIPQLQQLMIAGSSERANSLPQRSAQRLTHAQMNCPGCNCVGYFLSWDQVQHPCCPSTTISPGSILCNLDFNLRCRV